MREYFSSRSRVMIFFFITIIVPVWLTAQVIRSKGEANPHIDYNRLQRIDKLAEEYIGRHWLNGCVALVVKDNELISYKGYGFADAAAKKTMPANAIFRIMSQTKAITSVAAMMLYEEGRFLLDDPVSKFIPEFKNQGVLDQFNAADSSYTTKPANRDITIRDLLTHSSGLDYPGIGSRQMQAIYARAGIPSGLGHIGSSLLDRMRALAKLPLVHQPGEKWTYGLNSDLLGCLVEIWSGTSLEDFVTKQIFVPLDMNDTYFNVPAAKAQRLPAVYTEDDKHQVIAWQKGFRGIDPDYPLQHTDYFSGGAGLSSTALDYAIFLQMLLNKGAYNGHRILSPRTVEMMLSDQLDFSFNGTNNFGLGFELVSDKGARKEPRNKGSFSWGGYFGTYYWADPKENMVCLFMTQQTPNSHGDIGKKFEALVYASLK